jgi:hypothetical protein
VSHRPNTYVLAVPRPVEEAGAAASRGGRGGPAWGHTACHPRFTEGRSRARPSLSGAEGAAGASRRAQVLRDVISIHWKGGVTRTSTGLTRPRTICASHRPPPATASPSPRTSSTRPAPSKPRAPPGLNDEVAARAQRRDSPLHADKACMVYERRRSWSPVSQSQHAARAARRARWPHGPGAH